MVKPISPNEVVAQKLATFPDEVIETWNQLIAKKFDGSNTVKINQDEIVEALAAANGVDRKTVFFMGWLYIEDLYRRAGWSVKYEKPSYDEGHEPYFEFKRNQPLPPPAWPGMGYI